MVLLLLRVFRVFGSGFFLLGVFLVRFSLAWLGMVLAYFDLPTLPLSVGAGLGNRATYLWHRARFQSCGLG